MAIDMGAYAIGFVFYKGSRRYIHSENVREIISRLPPFITKVGVFVNEKWERIMEIKEFCRLDMVQIYGDYSGYLSKIIPEITIIAHRIRKIEDIESAKKSPCFPLLDSYIDGYGGGGKSFDWQFLKGFQRPYILAGGINGDNILDALNYKPYAIDITSGVEMSPGKKDPEKMRHIFSCMQNYEKGR